MKTQNNSSIVVSSSDLDTATPDADPNRIVAKFSVAGVTATVTAEQTSRTASAEIRRNIGAIIRGERYAAAIADSLCTLAEVADVAPRKLDVMIAMRRRGDLAKIAKA